MSPLHFRITAALVACLVAAAACCPAVRAEEPWPDVLVIDDFENGLDKWKNDDAGKLTLTEDAPQGDRALLWTAADDGIGHITYRNLDRKTIDFSQYDLLMFRVKVSGKPLWNLNPIVQQYPAVYGFRGLYYSVDTMHPYDRWYVYVQDLSRWENAWGDSYSREKQEFQFEIHQLAGDGHTRVYLDDIRLLKNPLGLRPSYPGLWSKLEDGSQVNHFHIELANGGAKPVTVRADQPRDAPGTIEKFVLTLPPEPFRLLSGEKRQITVSIAAPADALAAERPFYGETARVAFRVEETPGLVLFTELTAGTRPDAPEHPSILCGPKRMKELRRQYAKAETRAAMHKGLLAIVKRGEKTLSYVPEYPPSAAPGRTTDPVTKNRLVKIEVPNLPFNVYQDPVSGRAYSGPLYDAGMLGWAGKHKANAGAARKLALAHLVTGRREFAVAAASILREYITRYPALPLAPYEGASSPVGSACSGVTRIGGSYMHERVWLGNLAIALDSIRPSGVLTDEEIAAIGREVFVPSAVNMMDHKVGVMNLQWMIQSACLFAGLAVDDGGLVARAISDQHGIKRLVELGFLEDGQWWENPSYQGVAKLAAYPALAPCLHNGLLPWEPRYNAILKAAYKLHGPDERSPTLGTGGYRNFSFEDTGVFMFSRLIDDPELAWVVYNRKPRHGTYGLMDFALLLQGPPKIAEEKTRTPIPDGTTHMRDYGGVALRVPGTDRYCYVHYGRELVHGHRNKLSINAYGKGGWYARNIMGGYGQNFKDFLQTIASANTIMADGSDSDADTGELLFLESVPGAEMLSAREIGAYKDIEHERTVVLTAGPLIVLDRCVAEDEHTYDWLYHPNETGLTLDREGVAGAGVKSFGDSPLYSGLEPAGRYAKPDVVRWTRKPSKRHGQGGGVKIAFLPRGDLFVAHVSKKNTYRPHDSLLWRQKGKTVGWAAAFWPFARNETGEIRIEEKPVTNAAGRRIGLSEAQAVTVTTPEGRYTVLVNYSGKALQCGDLKSAKRVTVLVGSAE